MQGVVASFGGPCNWWRAATARLSLGKAEEVTVWNDDCGNLAIASLAGQEPIHRAHGCVLAVLGATYERAAMVRILGNYRRHGLRGLAPLSAEAGFVLWDGERRRAVAASGVLAQQPLAYVARRGHVAFSSRVVDLLGHPAVASDWDPVYLADWLAGMGSQAQTRTAFASIARCAPGSAVVWEPGRRCPLRVCSLDCSPGPRRHLPREAKGVFWALLDSYVAEAGEGSGVALSGGLDSALVAVTKGRCTDGTFNAYSYVPSSGAASWRQIESVVRLARQVPNMRVKFVRVDPARCGSSVRWEVHDDPPAGGAGGREGRRALLAEVAYQGDRVLLDGEGGDEVFELAVSWRDLWRQGLRAESGRLYLTDPRWGRRALLRAIDDAVPFSRGMAPRASQRNGFPSWLSESFWRSAPCQEAFAAYQARRQERDYGRRLSLIVTSAAFVGRLAADRLDGRCVGVQSRSPLVRPGILALAADVPASARVQRGAPKAFLRSIAYGHLPNCVIAAQEDSIGYASMLRRGLSAVSWETISAAAEAAPLVAEWIDLRGIERRFSQRASLPVREAEALYLLVQGLRWMASVAKLMPSSSDGNLR